MRVLPCRQMTTAPRVEEVSDGKKARVMAMGLDCQEVMDHQVVTPPRKVAGMKVMMTEVEAEEVVHRVVLIRLIVLTIGPMP